MYELLLNLIKECQKKIGNQVRVGFSMDEDRIILVARWGKEDLFYRYQFTATEVLDIASNEFPFNFFVRAAKERYDQHYQKYLLKGDNDEQRF